MARMTKEERVKGLLELIKANPITDGELDGARTFLATKAQEVEFSGKGILIPMQGGKYGYTTTVAVKVDGKDANASVTFMHPDATDTVDREHAVMHRLAEIRREEITANAAKPVSLEAAFDKASPAEQANVTMKGIKAMTAEQKAELKALLLA